MSTMQAAGSFDPPQVTTNVVGVKRIRRLITTDTTGAGSLTLGELRSCLPLTTPELRFIKLSAWGGDTDPLSVVFPVGSGTNLHPGDDAAWSDIGVPGSRRAQVHLTPAFDYRNFWFSSGMSDSTVIATFVDGPPPAAPIVDVTVQYRTAVQSCPALDHLAKLRAQSSS